MPLDLSVNRIADLWPTAYRAALDRLNLADNALEDLRPLAGLDLSGTAVADLSALGRVENLRWPQSPGTRSRNFFKLFSPCLFGSLLPYVIRDVRKIDVDLCGLKTDHKNRFELAISSAARLRRMASARVENLMTRIRVGLVGAGLHSRRHFSLRRTFASLIYNPSISAAACTPHLKQVENRWLPKPQLSAGH